LKKSFIDFIDCVSDAESFIFCFLPFSLPDGLFVGSLRFFVFWTV